MPGLLLLGKGQADRGGVRLHGGLNVEGGVGWGLCGQVSLVSCRALQDAAGQWASGFEKDAVLVLSLPFLGVWLPSRGLPPGPAQ